MNRLVRYEDRETLERLKRWPQLVGRFSHVRIYSAEHKAWWYGTGQGYTMHAWQSTVLPFDKAFTMTAHCGPEKRIQYVRTDSRISTDREKLDALPVYKSNATLEEKMEKRVTVRNQIAQLQGIDSDKAMVCCPCGTTLVVWMAYRCLYCGVFYCRTCAQLHYGQRLPGIDNEKD